MSVPVRPSDVLYELLLNGDVDGFNERRGCGETCELRGADLRSLDLRCVDVQDLDLSDAYLRGADLRGLDLRRTPLSGASMMGAKVSGTYFPTHISAREIQMSVELGTRLRG